MSITNDINMNPIKVKEPTIVTTIRGDKQDRKKCSKIKGNYYLRNRDCVKVKERYNRINNGKIMWDESKQKWIPASGDKIVMEFIDNKPVYKKAECLDFAYTDGDYYYDGDSKVNVKPDYSYIIRNDLSDYLTNPREYGKSNNPLHTIIDKYKNDFRLDVEILNKLWEPLSDYTYGVELETRSGVVNTKLLCETSVYPVRDGSIRGNEFITDIISNAESLTKLKYFTNIAPNYLSPAIDRGSMHLHIGGFDLSKKQFTALYVLCYKLQNDLDFIVPTNRGTAKYIYEKNPNKDYCKSLPRLNTMDDLPYEEVLDAIWKWMCENRPMDSNNNWDHRNHPRLGQGKWEWRSRFYKVNFIPYLFDHKGTIEFRLHHMTFDFREIYAWMLICKSIIDFAINSPDRCLDRKEKLYLSDIIEDVKLLKYIRSKQDDFNTLAFRHQTSSSHITNIKYLDV